MMQGVCGRGGGGGMDLAAGCERRALASSLEEALEKPPMEPRVQAEISRTRVAPPAPTPTRNCTCHRLPWVRKLFDIALVECK